MEDEVVAERRRKRREYMQQYLDNNPGQREKTRVRRRALIQKLKDEGKYDEFKVQKAARERKRMTVDPEFHRMRCGERQARWRAGHWEKVMLRNARSRALKKGLPFGVEVTDFVVPDICPVLGIAIDRNVGNMGDNSPSVDRIRPELGYVKGNVRVISQRANRLKCDGTAAEMKLVYEDLLRIEGA